MSTYNIWKTKIVRNKPLGIFWSLNFKRAWNLKLDFRLPWGGRFWTKVRIRRRKYIREMIKCGKWLHRNGDSVYTSGKFSFFLPRASGIEGKQSWWENRKMQPILGLPGKEMTNQPKRGIKKKRIGTTWIKWWESWFSEGKELYHEARRHSFMVIPITPWWYDEFADIPFYRNVSFLFSLCSRHRLPLSYASSWGHPSLIPPQLPILGHTDVVVHILHKN